MCELIPASANDRGGRRLAPPKDSGGYVGDRLVRVTGEIKCQEPPKSGSFLGTCRAIQPELAVAFGDGRPLATDCTLRSASLGVFDQEQRLVVGSVVQVSH